MEKLTIQAFNDYLKLRTTPIQKNNGFFIQENNKFFVCIKSEFYEKFKKSLINRRATIIAEQTKLVNKQNKKVLNYMFIDCHYVCFRKSAKALFKKYNIRPRKLRVLNPNFYKLEYESKRRNKA